MTATKKPGIVSNLVSEAQAAKASKRAEDRDLNSSREKQWEEAVGNFRDYYRGSKLAHISHGMFLQATVDCLTHLLVREHDNPQVIATLLSKAVYEAEAKKRKEAKK